MNRINEAASLDTIHEMLGSGKWTMDFDEAGVMVQVNWSDEFRRMIGYHGTGIMARMTFRTDWHPGPTCCILMTGSMC